MPAYVRFACINEFLNICIYPCVFVWGCGCRSISDNLCFNSLILARLTHFSLTISHTYLHLLLFFFFSFSFLCVRSVCLFGCWSVVVVQYPKAHLFLVGILNISFAWFWSPKPPSVIVFFPRLLLLFFINSCCYHYCCCCYCQRQLLSIDSGWLVAGSKINKIATKTTITMYNSTSQLTL